jgi:hypothetical protein
LAAIRRQNVKGAIPRMVLTKFERQERQRVIAAFQRLAVPAETWTPLVGPEPTERDGGWIALDPFRPPAFNRYEETPEEWKARATSEFQEYLDDLLADWQIWMRIGFDKPVRGPKRRRAGKASIAQRYEWAAHRLIGREWKDIAAEYFKVDSADELDNATTALRKAATEVLRCLHLTPDRK